MTTIIIAVVYILGVFVAREVDRLVCSIEEGRYGMWGLWFMSWFTFIAIVMYYQIEYKPIKFKKNWFTGKYWKNN